MPDFTEASDLTGTEFRELGMSLANQLPGEAMTAMLPDRWAAAHPKHVLVHRIEEARQVANRKRDDRQKRREKSPPLLSAPQRIGEPERRWNEWVPRTLTSVRQFPVERTARRCAWFERNSRFRATRICKGRINR